MGRVASPSQCGKCGAHIRSGLDADALAFVARVDDEPLSRQGELLAVLAGRRTYSLEGGRLYRRQRHHLRKPADIPYVEHRCWEPFPAAWLAAPATPSTTDDRPPF